MRVTLGWVGGAKEKSGFQGGGPAPVPGRPHGPHGPDFLPVDGTTSLSELAAVGEAKFGGLVGVGPCALGRTNKVSAYGLVFQKGGVGGCDAHVSLDGPLQFVQVDRFG